MTAGPTTSAGTAGDSELKRSITGRLLFFYVLGDVLGSGIYVLIGAVAAVVGGAFWIAFGVGVAVATITGLAYAELVTKYPQAAGAALYVNKAFRNRTLTFVVTICALGAVFAAAGSLATGFATYFDSVWSLPPALLVSIGFILVLAVVNYIGITESVVINMVMTIVEVVGLVIVLAIGVVFVARGDADFSGLTTVSTDGSVAWAIVAGVALAVFAMTGFENAANVAEETIDPARTFPKALVGGMICAGVIYVLVAMTAQLVVGAGTLSAASEAGEPSLLEVVKADVLPVSVTLFAVIAMIAITNTTLVAVVTQSRILYGMAREDVVPGVFAKVHPTRRSPWVALILSAAVVVGLLVVGELLAQLGLEIDLITTLANVTVLLLLVIYDLVIISALKLRGDPDTGTGATFRAPTPLLAVGLVGNLVLAVYVVVDDWTSLLWCGGLVGVGLVLFAAEKAFGSRTRPPGAPPSTADPTRGA